MATRAALMSAGLQEIRNTACEGAALDLGATVTGWRPHGQGDVLFLSRDARVGEGDEIHGGIPLCAPWFGRGRDGVEVPHRHGLVRWVPWRRTASHIEDGATTLAWELRGDALRHLPGASDYPPDLLFRHEARFADTLTVSLTVTSPSTTFVMDQAFHAYFAVTSVADVVIGGLEGRPFRDYTDDGRWQESGGPLVVDGHLDRIYSGAGPLTVTDSNRVLTLSTQGAANTIVWNPGPDGAHTLQGWGADEWTCMVCVEVGNVQRDAVTVTAGTAHTLSLEVRSEPLATAP